MQTTVEMKKEQRGHMATQTATNAAAKEGLVRRSPSERGFATAEKNACSLQARMDGEECEAWR